MADNKININVEVVNNTKSSIDTIMADLKNMNADIKTAITNLNSTISSEMQKVSTTLLDANKSLTNSIGSNYNTLKSEAEKSAKGVTDAFNKSSENLKKVSEKTTESINSDINKRISSEKAVYDNRLNSAIQVANKEIEQSKRVSKSIIDDTKKSTASHREHANAIDQLTKRFISLAAAIYLIRQASRAAIESVKDYEEAAKSSLGNKAAGPRLQQIFGQYAVEIGSVLEPHLQEFASFLEKNSVAIENFIRRSINVLVNLSKTVLNIDNTVALGLVAIYDNSVNMLIQFTDDLIRAAGSTKLAIKDIFDMDWSKLSEKMDKYSKMSPTQKDSVRTAQIKKGEQEVPHAFIPMETGSMDKLVESLDKVKNDFMAIFDKPKASGVKFITKEVQSKIEEFKKWAAELKAQANQITINEDAAKQLKVDEDYKKRKMQIAEYEKILSKGTAEDHAILNQAKLDSDKIYAEQTSVISQQMYERDKKIMDDLHKQRIDELNAAIGAASSAGLVGSTIRPTTPGSAALTNVTGSVAAGKVSVSGSEELKKKLESDLKLYTDLNNTIGDNDAQLAEMRINIATETSNALAQIEYDATQARVDSISKTVDAYTQGASMIVEIANNIYQVQLNNISRETDERQKALDKSYANASKYVKNKGKLDKQQKEASDKLQDEQAAKAKEIQEKQKNAAIANALIAGAVATMNAWSSSMQMGMPAGLIMGIAMSVVIAALTATQIAVIESQKFAGGGIVQGPTTGDTVPIQANGGEMMLNTSQQASLWNMIASKSGSTSSSSNNINMAGDTYIVSGSLDKSAVSEIRRMKEERQMQLRSDIKELSYRNQLQLV